MVVVGAAAADVDAAGGGICDDAVVVVTLALSSLLVFVASAFAGCCVSEYDSFTGDWVFGWASCRVVPPSLSLLACR